MRFVVVTVLTWVGIAVLLSAAFAALLNHFAPRDHSPPRRTFDWDEED